MYAGVDEAGRGPVLGPLVVAGVAGDLEDLPDGMADSKTLNPQRRRELAEALEEAPVQIAVRLVDADELNERMGAGENLNRVEARAFADVLCQLDATQALLDQVGPDGEAFAAEVGSHVTHACELEARIEADGDDPVVGAASIVAKVERDAAVEQIAEELDAEVGSGYAHDERTRTFLEAWREESIHPPPYTRHAWATLDHIGFGQARLTEDVAGPAIDAEEPTPTTEEEPR